jgi:hypothetical protein
MSTLWVFGDNNSSIFGRTKERRFKYYKEYRKGKFPKSWSELLSKELNLYLKNMAVSGQSNYDIFYMFCKCAEQIKKNDIVIIGWSYVQRFRLIDNNTNSFVTIRPNQFKPEHINKPTLLNGIDINLINSILKNRENTEWINEVYSWEIIINLLSNYIGFKPIYWTFDKVLNKSYYISTDDFRNDLIKMGAEDITSETNGELIDDNFGEKGQLVQFDYFLKKMLYE